MKFKLMIQSMSPLAVLTIISNYSFRIVSDTGDRLTFEGFLKSNAVLLFVMTICAFWVLLGFFYFISFGAFRWTDKKRGYSICSVTEKDEDSLNFFLTLIIPLLLDNVDKWQGALSFFIILLFICVLLYRTNLFYANPVLAVLGYHVYCFSFEENSEFGGVTCIGLCKGTVNEGESIEYKVIAKNVLYIKGI